MGGFPPFAAEQSISLGVNSTAYGERSYTEDDHCKRNHEAEHCGAWTGESELWNFLRSVNGCRRSGRRSFGRGGGPGLSSRDNRSSVALVGASCDFCSVGVAISIGVSSSGIVVGYKCATNEGRQAGWITSISASSSFSRIGLTISIAISGSCVIVGYKYATNEGRGGRKAGRITSIGTSSNFSRVSLTITIAISGSCVVTSNDRSTDTHRAVYNVASVGADTKLVGIYEAVTIAISSRWVVTSNERSTDTRWGVCGVTSVGSGTKLVGVGDAVSIAIGCGCSREGYATAATSS